MQGWRLKNIIILILALVNVFLLGSLVVRQTADRSSFRQAAAELSALFAADSVTLTPSAISKQTLPEGRTLSRSMELDRKVAVFLLGDAPDHADKGGGIHGYTSPRGSALFRSSGDFEAVGQLSGDSDAESFCRRFCRTFGYEDLVLSLEDGSGTAVAVQSHNGYPVTNCTVTFTVRDGQVTALSGTHLPDAYTNTDGTVPLSALTALTTFLEYRRSSGALVSQVTALSPCYELQSTTTAPMTLVPAWCVSTDAGNYYVNSFTGAVSHG